MDILSNLNLRATPFADSHLVHRKFVLDEIAAHNESLKSHSALLAPLVLYAMDANGNLVHRPDGFGEYVCVATPSGGINLVRIGVLDEGFFGGDVSEEGTSVEELETSIRQLRSWSETEIGRLNTEIANLRTFAAPMPITFAFAGVPAVNSLINVPLTMNLSIAANLSGSRYYNTVNPASSSTFRLTVLPAGTTIGTISVATNGTATFSGTGSTTLTAANTLRMTAITVGADLTDVSITVHALRR